jgi:hypothetical protein
LRELQRSFAAALMAGGDAVAVCIDGAGLDPSARLRIYRHSVAGTQIAALRDSYPTVRALVGDEFFEVLASRYRVRYPSTCGNFQQFGSAMDEFVADMPEVEHLHYLADVARLDWLRQCAALAADAQPVGHTASAAAAAVPPERLRIRLHPSLHLLHSEYAVLSVFRWCQSPSDPAPRLDGGAEYVLLWRDGGEVAMAAVEPATYRCIEALSAARDVAAAWAAATALDANFDLEPCLRDLLARDLIVECYEEDGST